MPHRGWHRGWWVAASSVPHSGVIWSLQLWGGRGGGSLVASTRTPSWPPRGTPGSAPSPWAEPSAPQLLPIAAPCPPCRPPAFRPGPASAEAVGNQRNPALSGAVPTFPVGKLRHGDGLCVSKAGHWVFNPSPALPGLQQHLPSFVYNPEGGCFFFFFSTGNVRNHLPPPPIPAPGQIPAEGSVSGKNVSQERGRPCWDFPSPNPPPRGGAFPAPTHRRSG